MPHQELDLSQRGQIARLFADVFTSSEGAEEGRLVGNLADRLAAQADSRRILCLGTMEEQTLVASIFFSRLTFPAGEPVYMLAPLAVATDWQGRGVGQSLVRYGLGELHRRGVSVAVTYGDVAFYGKVGFEPLSEEILPAPMDLSMPFGWLGQSLNDGPIEVRDSRPACVEPFRDPAYW